MCLVVGGTVAVERLFTSLALPYVGASVDIVVVVTSQKCRGCLQRRVCDSLLLCIVVGGVIICRRLEILSCRLDWFQHSLRERYTSWMLVPERHPKLEHIETKNSTRRDWRCSFCLEVQRWRSHKETQQANAAVHHSVILSVVDVEEEVTQSI